MLIERKNNHFIIGLRERISWIELQRYFLMAAFPIHLWAIFIIMGNVQWVAERTNMGNAVGYAGYSLVLAFLESVPVFIVLFLVNLLLPRRWAGEKRLAFVGGMYYILAFWAMVGQFYFWADTEPFTIWWRIVYHARRLNRVIYPLIYMLVPVSVVGPAWFLLKSERWVGGMKMILERLETLTYLYLFLDAIGLVIVWIRNV